MVLPYSSFAMALTFNPLDAARKLRANGMEEATANATVEVVVDATSPLVTTEHFDQTFQRFEESVDRRFAEQRAEFRAELYRVSLIQGGIVIGAVVALVKLL